MGIILTRGDGKQIRLNGKTNYEVPEPEPQNGIKMNYLFEDEWVKPDIKRTFSVWYVLGIGLLTFIIGFLCGFLPHWIVYNWLK